LDLFFCQVFSSFWNLVYRIKKLFIIPKLMPLRLNMFNFCKILSNEPKFDPFVQ
jgi:hypothetical protein